VTNDERRAPGGPGEQFRDKLVSSVSDRSDDETFLAGAVVVIAVILLLIPRGATGPDLWLIVALVCGGAIIETYRIRRSGQTLSASAAAAVRLLAGPLLFVVGAAIFVTVAQALAGADIPQPVLIIGALIVGLAAGFVALRMFRIQ
jgi:hypothetical protein